MILGAPRSGKSVNGNHIILSEQKYGGYTFVIDIGGSYESTVRLLGGSVERIGTRGPRINPFSLEPTEANLAFLFQLVRLLLLKGGAHLSPGDEDVVEKSVRRMYLVNATVRRVKDLRNGQSYATGGTSSSFSSAGLHETIRTHGRPHAPRAGKPTTLSSTTASGSSSSMISRSRSST